MTKSNIRVAGIVCQVRRGQLFVATHVPAKAKGLNDYSVTTITGTFNGVLKRGSSLEGQKKTMEETVCQHLGVLPIAILQNSPVPMEPRFHKEKVYVWQFVQLTPGAVVNPNPSEIQNLIWNNPQQLATSVLQMSGGRHEMFVDALQEVCRIGLFGASFRSELLEQLKPAMKILA